MYRFRSILGALVAAFLAVGAACTGETETTGSGSGSADREFTLVAIMTGYYGRGGDIDGVRNPTLSARKGESVSITIINGERMAHDIALRRHRVRSNVILENGAITGIYFIAETDDRYYCTIPGHVETGMAGDFTLMDDTPAIARNGL